MNPHAGSTGSLQTAAPARQRIEALAFEAAALPHIDDLFRTALYVVGNSNEAETLVRHTYLRARRAAHRAPIDCRAWLFGILFRHIHRDGRIWFHPGSLQDGEESLAETLEPECRLPETLEERDVLAAFEKIPSNLREVLLLVEIVDFSFDEAAEILRIPASKVISRLGQGRRMLRAGLGARRPAESTGPQ